MSRTRWRMSVVLLLCLLSLEASVILRQRMQRWTKEAESGLSAAEVDDRQELAALWQKPAVKPVSTRQQVYQSGGGGIGAMAFSHDGKHLAIAGHFRNVSIWNTTDWTLAKALDLQGIALCLAFSPDDRFLYAGGLDDRDTVHCRFNWQEGKLDKTYAGHNQGVKQIILSPDGRTMISLGYIDHTVRIWDVETATILRSLTWYGVGMAYAPKKNLLVLLRDWGRGGAIVHLDEKAAQQIKLEDPFADAAFSPDEKLLFTFGSTLAVRQADDPARVLREKSFAERGGRGLFDVAPRGMLAVAPDGKQIALACTDQRVAMVTLPDLKPVKKLDPPVNLIPDYDSISALAYSPDGRWLLAAENTRNRPRFFRVATGEEALPFDGHGDYFIDMRFAADGRTLRSVGRDNSVCIWDAATLKMLRRYSVPGGRWIASIRPSDGGYAMCVVRGTGRQPTVVLDLETGAAVCEVPPLPSSWEDQPPLQTWDSLGTRFFWLKEPEAMFVFDGRFRRFNYRTGEVLAEGKVDIQKNNAFFNTRGEPTEDGTRLFDAHDGGKRSPPWTADETLLPSLEFRRLGTIDTIGNPDGPFGLVPGGKYFYIGGQIFDRRSLKRVAAKTFADGSLSELSFNADGTRYVTVVVPRRDANEWPPLSSNLAKIRPLLRVQETLTGRTLLAVPLSNLANLSRLSPDGRQVAAALWDGTIEVWPVP